MRTTPVIPMPSIQECELQAPAIKASLARQLRVGSSYAEPYPLSITSECVQTR